MLLSRLGAHAESKTLVVLNRRDAIEFGFGAASCRGPEVGRVSITNWCHIATAIIQLINIQVFTNSNVNYGK